MVSHGLIDLSWAQQAQQLELDDIDKDPKYSKYPYQDAGYEDEEENIEVDERAPDKAGGFHVTVPNSTRRSYYHPEAKYSRPGPDQTPGSPRSIHTDMDVAMEIGGLGMGPSSGARKVIPHREALPKPTGML